MPLDPLQLYVAPPGNAGGPLPLLGRAPGPMPRGGPFYSMRTRWQRWPLVEPESIPNAAATSDYTQSLSGSVTASGSVVFLVSKSLSGSTTGTGSLAKLAAKPFTGSLTPLAAVTKAVAKSAAGSCTGSGGLAKAAAKPMAGSTTPAAALANRPNKSASGSTTPTSTQTHLVTKPMAGNVTAAGVTARLLTKPAMGGSCTPTGGLTNLRAAILNVAGAVTATSSLVRVVFKRLVGSLSPFGSLSNAGGGPSDPDDALVLEHTFSLGGRDVTYSLDDRSQTYQMSR